jgi:hypothetical protein
VGSCTVKRVTGKALVMGTATVVLSYKNAFGKQVEGTQKISFNGQAADVDRTWGSCPGCVLVNTITLEGDLPAIRIQQGPIDVNVDLSHYLPIALPSVVVKSVALDVTLDVKGTLTIESYRCVEGPPPPPPPPPPAQVPGVKKAPGVKKGAKKAARSKQR